MALLATAIALVTATPASAGGKRYEGAFATGGTNSFTLKKTRNGKKVFNYQWDGFSLSCDGGPRTSSNGLSFAVRVQNRKFEAVASPSTTDRARLSIKGRFVGRSSAEGTMRMEGSRVPVDGGGKDRCDSGKVPWIAQRAPN